MHAFSSVAVAPLVGLCLLVGACHDGDRAASANVPDIPIYPGATLREAVVGPNLDPTEYYVVTGVPERDVRSWYRARMPRAGWTANDDADDSLVFYHTDKGCYGFVGVFTRPDGNVELQVSEQRADTPCFPYLTPDPTGGTE
jgi:hypothetical protein